MQETYNSVTVRCDVCQKFSPLNGLKVSNQGHMLLQSDCETCRIPIYCVTSAAELVEAFQTDGTTQDSVQMDLKNWEDPRGIAH